MEIPLLWTEFAIGRERASASPRNDHAFKGSSRNDSMEAIIGRNMTSISQLTEMGRDFTAVGPLSRPPAGPGPRLPGIGREEGAEVVIGDGRLGGEAYDRGFFAEPTIFDRLAPDIRIAQEKIFNPVPSVFTGRSVRPRARAAATLAAAMSSLGARS
ncbi:aldehyde dehydrogenase family protein [Streptomyces sp. NPDC058735]